MGLFGFTGERLKHIISRYPLLLKVGEKWDYSRATGRTYSAEKKWDRIEGDVNAHKVSESLALITKWFKKEKKAAENAKKGEMDQMFLYYHILKITHHFVTALGRFLEEANKKGSTDIFKARVNQMSRKIIPKLKAELKQTENFGGEDERFFMAEMNDALEEGPGKFVDSWRTKFKRKNIGSRFELILERRAFRSGVNQEYGDMKLLEKLAKQLEGITSQLKPNAKAETLQRMLNQFERILNTSEKAIVEMFGAAHIVLKRWLIEMAIILSDEKNIEVLGPRWVQMHYEPGTPINQKIMDVRELEKKISQNLHDVANALNVHIKEMKGIETGLDRDLAAAA